MALQWKSLSPSPWTKTPLRSIAKRGGIVRLPKEACPQLHICLWLTRAEGRTLHLCTDHRHHVGRECAYTTHTLQATVMQLTLATGNHTHNAQKPLSRDMFLSLHHHSFPPCLCSQPHYTPHSTLTLLQ